MEFRDYMRIADKIVRHDDVTRLYIDGFGIVEKPVGCSRYGIVKINGYTFMDVKLTNEF